MICEYKNGYIGLLSKTTIYNLYSENSWITAWNKNDFFNDSKRKKWYKIYNQKIHFLFVSRLTAGNISLWDHWSYFLTEVVASTPFTGSFNEAIWKLVSMEFRPCFQEYFVIYFIYLL